MLFSNKYEVLGELGKGGMGQVYKVRHINLKKSILALKVLPAYLMESQEMVDRFYHEARVMDRLNHPNIVKVRDIERDEKLNLYYIVMEYIEGTTLSAYLRETGPLSLPEIFRMSRQVADALAYAHQQTPPVIHRDIKPSNIMIEDHSSRVVVMDFGIAKELEEKDMTRTGTVIGTIKYASPEQIRHEQLDGRADVYSLGMVMYEMYTGKQFFAGLDETTVIGKVLYDPHENEPQFENPPPSSFADLIRKTIKKNRALRHQHMREFITALDKCRDEHAKQDSESTIILQQSNEGGQHSTDATANTGANKRQPEERDEEKNTHRVLQLQTQAQAARERATQAGAAELTIPFLHQAQGYEALGKKSIEANDFTAAQQAFHEAILLFQQAEAEAAKQRAQRASSQRMRRRLLATSVIVVVGAISSLYYGMHSGWISPEQLFSLGNVSSKDSPPPSPEKPMPVTKTPSVPEEAKAPSANAQPELTTATKVALPTESAVPTPAPQPSPEVSKTDLPISTLALTAENKSQVPIFVSSSGSPDFNSKVTNRFREMLQAEHYNIVDNRSDATMLAALTLDVNDPQADYNGPIIQRVTSTHLKLVMNWVVDNSVYFSDQVEGRSRGDSQETTVDLQGRALLDALTTLTSNLERKINKK